VNWYDGTSAFAILVGDPSGDAIRTRAVSSTVTVTGEVANSSRVPLSIGGDRILDVIAAGGLRAPINETYVELTRGKNFARIPLISVTNKRLFCRWPSAFSHFRFGARFLPERGQLLRRSQLQAIQVSSEYRK
jgi:protein involved in polysaccharide export with SLBB domain